MEKIYYSFRETIQLTGVTDATLRFWEKKFPQLSPRKDNHGNRYYTSQDVEFVKQIKYLRDEMKITRIEAIRMELQKGSRKVDVRSQATDILKKIKQELIDIKEQI